MVHYFNYKKSIPKTAMVRNGSSPISIPSDSNILKRCMVDVKRVWVLVPQTMVFISAARSARAMIKYLPDINLISSLRRFHLFANNVPSCDPHGHRRRGGWLHTSLSNRQTDCICWTCSSRNGICKRGSGGQSNQVGRLTSRLRIYRICSYCAGRIHVG